MSGKKRKTWPSEEKLRIVLAGMDPGVEVSELCRREGVSPALYYSWKKTLLGSASKVFDTREQKPSRKEERMASELSRCKDVIAEITSENLELKKTLSD